MPKVYDTRKQVAIQLMERLRRGPSLNPSVGHKSYGMSKVDAERQCRQWLTSWIIPDVLRLVPEYKKLPQHYKE